MHLLRHRGQQRDSVVGLVPVRPQAVARPGTRWGARQWEFVVRMSPTLTLAGF